MCKPHTCKRMLKRQSADCSYMEQHFCFRVESNSRVCHICLLELDQALTSQHALPT